MKKQHVNTVIQIQKTHVLSVRAMFALQFNYKLLFDAQLSSAQLSSAQLSSAQLSSAQLSSALTTSHPLILY